jgi:hypothetical protein
MPKLEKQGDGHEGAGGAENLAPLADTPGGPTHDADDSDDLPAGVTDEPVGRG